MHLNQNISSKYKISVIKQLIKMIVKKKKNYKDCKNISNSKMKLSKIEHFFQHTNHLQEVIKNFFVGKNIIFVISF